MTDEEYPTGPAERDIEAPEADAAEQATPARPADQPDEYQPHPEVGEWDAVEQSRTVDIDEDY